MSLELRKYLPQVAAALCVAFCVSAQSALGGLINYGDFGPDLPDGVVMYQQVRESGDDVPPPKFGAPDIEVNTLDFDPTNFSATSAGGGVDSINVQLNTTVMTAFPGRGITSLSIQEAGDYSLFGTGGAGTAVAAGLGGVIRILEIDGVVPANPIPLIDIADYTTPFVADLTGGIAVGEGWTNGALVEFGPLFSYNVGVTKLEIMLDDVLLASSQENSFAQIHKKEFIITPGGELTPFPEPTAVMLSVLGLFGVGAFRRR